MSDYQEPPFVALYDSDVPVRHFMAQYQPEQSFYSLSFPTLIKNLINKSLNEVQNYFENCLYFLAMNWQKKGEKIKKILLFVEYSIIKGYRISPEWSYFIQFAHTKFEIRVELIEYRKEENQYIFSVGNGQEIVIGGLNPEKIIINCCDPRMNIILQESNDYIISVPGTVYMVMKYFFNKHLLQVLRQSIDNCGSKELIIIYHTPDCAAHMANHSFKAHENDHARTLRQAERKLQTAIRIFREKFKDLPELRIVGQCINIAQCDELPTIITWGEMDDHGKLLPLDHLTREIALWHH